MEEELSIDDKMGKLKKKKKRRKNNLFGKIKGQMTKDGTSLQVKCEMLEQPKSCLLADTDCHDAALLLKIREKRKCRRCTCTLVRCERWHPRGA